MSRITRIFLASCALFAAPQPASAQPASAWPASDEIGMANTLGSETWKRCAPHLAKSKAKAYELSHLRSNTMPQSPFGTPLVDKYRPTVGIPGTMHAFNGEETVSGEPGAQGTQMDAIGHFAVLPEKWDGKGEFPADKAKYYGGYTQKDVKPTPDSPLLKLGIEMIRPIITSAVVLDAKALVGGGQPMKAGEVVTTNHIEAMLKAQGLEKRGILPGDVVYVRTGWGDHWQDPDTEKMYYSKAPGLSYDAAKYLGEKRIVAIGLDTPFIDPVPEGMLAGKAGPAVGVPDGIPFALHHHMLTQMGIHHIENAKLDELANDKVWTSCTMILPPREKGSAGAAVRPVAVGVPGK